MVSFTWEFSGKIFLQLNSPYLMIAYLSMFLLSVFYMIFLLQKKTRMLFYPPPQTAEIPPASDPQLTAN